MLSSKSGLIVWLLLVLVLLSINGLDEGGTSSCLGGRSVRGYDRLDNLHRYSPSSSSNSLFMTASCCEKDMAMVTCHGGVVLQSTDLPAATALQHDNDDDAHHTLTLNDAQRHKR